MATRSPTSRDWTIGRLADRQFGVVSRAQLLARGLSADVIGDAVRAGRLRPLHRGVYAVGHVQLRREGTWMAALLACGEGSVLSHQSAAALWRIGDGGVDPIDLIVAGDGGRKRRGIKTRRQVLAADEILVRDGLRVTTPERTLVDLAAAWDGRTLRKLVERAQDARRFNPAAIERVAARRPHHRGTAALLALATLLGPDADRAASELERLFLKLCRRARVPPPLVNELIGGRRRDFVWPDVRLVIETDGYAYHSSRRAFRRDRQRDRELTALGWRPARFTFEEVVLEPRLVVAEIGALHGRRPRKAPTRPSRSS